MDSLVSSGTLVLEIKKEQQVWYTERIPYPMINPGDTQVVQATQVVYFVDQGNYQLRCFAENNQDENALNDTLSFEFVLHQNRLKEIEGTWNHYPNPVNNKEVTVLSSGQISHVTMLDVLGRSHPVKLDRPKEPQNNQYRVHWHQELSPGTYYLIVITNNTRVNLRIIVP
jgi:hypothetical protein